MGLTIHYGLKTDCTEVEAARSLVQQFREVAKQLPFQSIGEIVEFQGDQCKHGSRDDSHGWLKIQAGQYLQDGDQYAKVYPLHFIAFTAVPGEGSEPTNIGLARYPEFIDIERPRKLRLRTKMPDWSWKVFTKTQYASDPAVGGVPNFVRCHLSVVSLLDAIQKRNLATVTVSDESDYWDHRDVRKLAEVVGEWNEMVAAIAGQFKDAGEGFELHAPITQFATFEHMEARGRDKLDKPTS
jgi:hypothetical protein